MPAKKHIEFDGNLIFSEKDFHMAISLALDFGPYYGNNLDALWDMLSSGMGDGIILHWQNAHISENRLGIIFEKIIAIFNSIKKLDIENKVTDEFEFILE